MSLRLLLALTFIAGCRVYDVVYTEDGGLCPMPPNVSCPTNPCSNPASDQANCGACGTECSVSQLCTPSVDNPALGVCTACPSGQSVCAGGADGGANGAAFCTDLSTDDSNCGVCFVRCDHGTQCQSSQCTCTLTSCPDDGGIDCIDTQSDIEHCGSCDTPCPPPAPNETALCTGGNCSEQCITPFADCDGIGSNGCETNLLTSATNCGICGRSCNGPCVAGMCTITTYNTTGSQLMGLALDPSFVYWADDTQAGVILKAPIGGGAVQTVYATSTITTQVAVDATRVAWLSSNGDVDSRLLSGGAVTNLASTAGDAGFTPGTSMALVSGTVYFSTVGGTVSRVPEDGSTGAVTITTISQAASSVAVDGTKIYFIDVSGDVLSAPENAQNANASLFSSGQSITSIAVDPTNVYWASSTGEIAAQKKTSSSSQVIALGLLMPGPLATDGISVYWVNGDGSIQRAPVGGGGTPLILATMQGTPTSIAVDGTNVYWTSPTTVASTPK